MPLGVWSGQCIERSFSKLTTVCFYNVREGGRQTDDLWIAWPSVASLEQKCILSAIMTVPLNVDASGSFNWQFSLWGLQRREKSFKRSLVVVKSRRFKVDQNLPSMKWEIWLWIMREIQIRTINTVTLGIKDLPGVDSTSSSAILVSEDEKGIFFWFLNVHNESNLSRLML